MTLRVFGSIFCFLFIRANLSSMWEVPNLSPIWSADKKVYPTSTQLPFSPKSPLLACVWSHKRCIRSSHVKCTFSVVWWEDICIPQETPKGNVWHLFHIKKNKQKSRMENYCLSKQSGYLLSVLDTPRPIVKRFFLVSLMKGNNGFNCWLSFVI